MRIRFNTGKHWEAERKTAFKTEIQGAILWNNIKLQLLKQRKLSATFAGHPWQPGQQFLPGLWGPEWWQIKVLCQEARKELTFDVQLHSQPSRNSEEAACELLWCRATDSRFCPARGMDSTLPGFAGSEQQTSPLRAMPSRCPTVGLCTPVTCWYDTPAFPAWDIYNRTQKTHIQLTYLWQLISVIIFNLQIFCMGERKQKHNLGHALKQRMKELRSPTPCRLLTKLLIHTTECIISHRDYEPFKWLRSFLFVSYRKKQTQKTCFKTCIHRTSQI